MKKRLLLPLLLALAGCETQDQKYEAAKALAKGTKAPNLAFGFGFRPGMTESEVAQKLAKLRGTVDEGIKLPSGTFLQAKEIKPGFANHQLAELNVFFQDMSILDSHELEGMLGKRYGSGPKQFSHGNGGVDERTSWFAGPVEIEMSYDKTLGGWLEYTDLRLEDQYLKEYVEGMNREREAEEAAQKKEGEKL